MDVLNYFMCNGFDTMAAKRFVVFFQRKSIRYRLGAGGCREIRLFVLYLFESTRSVFAPLLHAVDEVSFTTWSKPRDRRLHVICDFTSITPESESAVRLSRVRFPPYYIHRTCAIRLQFVYLYTYSYYTPTHGTTYTRLVHDLHVHATRELYVFYRWFAFVYPPVSRSRSSIKYSPTVNG